MNLPDDCGSAPWLWEEILACMQQCVLVMDAEGLIHYSSSTVQNTLGFDPRELKGTNLARLLTPEDLQFLYPNLLCLAANRRAFEGEVMLVRKDRTRFIAFLVTRPCRDLMRGLDWVIVSVEDIHEQKELERKIIKSHYQDLIQMANGIAHEIRNPLVGIGGFVNRLYHAYGAGQEYREYYDLIMENLRRIENVIQKVEFFARLPEPSFKETSLGNALNRAAESFADQLKARGIRFVSSLGEVTLRIDENLLERVFSVLLENSLAALPDGGTITVDAQMDRAAFTVRFSDNGSGISPEHLPHVFNPFFSTKADGVGIDLALVKRILEIHRGSVGVQSVLGEGTTFLLEFPLDRRRPIRTCLFPREQGAGGKPRDLFA